MILPWWPVVWVDILGSAAAFVLGYYCLYLSWQWTIRKRDDTFRHYVFLLTVAIGAFTISRSVGHLVKQVLLSADQAAVWAMLSSFSGSLNTATFIIIFAFSIYFDRLRNIKIRADRIAVELATAHTRANAAVEAETRLRAVFDGFGDAIYLIDRQRRVRFFNQALQQLLPGIQPDGFCYELLYGRQEPCVDCHLETVLRGESRSHEKKLPVLKMTVQVTEVPIVWPDGNKVKLTVLRDVTEKKLLEAQLLQSQKMEAVGVLAGGIAHDFNNLLTVISGHAEIMLKRDKTDDLQEDAASILKAARQAGDLTRKLLLFSRKDIIQPRVMDLNGLVGDLLKMLARLIGEDIELEAELSPASLPVKIDPGQIEQVVMNLVVNARDAMPEGGRILIQCEEVSLDESYCKTLLHARPGRFVRLTVADGGCGMSRETMDRIFEPFFTTKGLHKGTGLGLSVVHGIIEQHGGWVNVYSETGHGTTFRIYLPVCLEDDLQTGGADESLATLPRGNGERILLVEDEEKVRKVTKAMLSASGYRVWEAADVTEAEELFAQRKEQIDLVLSDIVLPDGNGLQVLDRIQALRPGVPVLLMSGYADEKSQWPTILSRKVPFIHKPFTFASLLAFVRQPFDNQPDP